MKRILAILLSFATILAIGSLTACRGRIDDTTESSSPLATTRDSMTENTTQSENSDTQTDETSSPMDSETDMSDETTMSEGNGDTETTTPPDAEPEEYDPYNKLAGYENIDFGGRIFLIATYEGSDQGGGGRWDNFREVYSEESDAISSAVRNRNMVVEKLYNCSITTHKSTAPDNAAKSEVTANQHTIDLYSKQYTSTDIAADDQSFNLYNLGIDFSKPWWDKQWVNTYTIKNDSGVDTLYAAVGDFAFNAFSATGVMFYNKTLYEQKLSDVDIYQLVRDKKWTVDQFSELLKREGIASDANGNSEYRYEDGDILSWVRVPQVTHALQTASGLSIIQNKNGVLTFEPADNTNAWVDVVNQAIALYNIPGTDTISYINVQKAIEGNTALFASEVLDVLERMKNADIRVGLVPYPLYSETQENYAHYVDDHFCTYSVPISVPDPETVGAFFEVYAFHSAIVRDAYINTYCVEYCGDSESAEMLDIILDSRTYDPGYLWWDSTAEISNMIETGKNNMTNWIGKKGGTIEKSIADFMTQLNDNKN